MTCVQSFEWALTITVTTFAERMEFLHSMANILMRECDSRIYYIGGFGRDHVGFVINQLSWKRKNEYAYKYAELDFSGVGLLFTMTGDLYGK